MAGCAVDTRTAQPPTSKQPQHRPHTKTKATQTRPNTPPPTPPAPTPANSEAIETSSNSGVATLLQQAQEALAMGDSSRAQALAERAQALAPRQPHSYLELAKIYQQRGDNHRARQMALRGLPFTAENSPLQHALQQFNAQ